MRLTTGWQSQDPASNASRSVDRAPRPAAPTMSRSRVDYCGVCRSDLHAFTGCSGEEPGAWPRVHRRNHRDRQCGDAVPRKC